MEKVARDREVIDFVKVLGPKEAEEYLKKKKKSAFNIIQDYEDNEEENVGFAQTSQI
jgi:hypothetical protein